MTAITPAEGVAPGNRGFIAIDGAWPDGVEAVDRLVADYTARD